MKDHTKIEFGRGLVKLLRRLHNEATEDMAKQRKADLRAKTRIFDR